MDRTGPVTGRLAAVVLAALTLAAPGLVTGQWAGAPAQWALPSRDSSAVLVAYLPVARRYRVCNDSHSAVVLTADSPERELPLPPRSCIDVQAHTMTVSQRGVGIPARGTYQTID
ncbi:MAG: hypothetical protein HY294_09285 [Candidatus Rokubacteria bacterium]|nr:hypothetical protein [Candidatus Rokubacteria bacterium]MBI3826179.1 hypothetical protein [Candidatus Rokubacteria bacterium]